MSVLQLAKHSRRRFSKRSSTTMPNLFFCPSATDPALRPCCEKRISLQGSMKRHVKYDNAQQGSKVGAKLPVQVTETHKSRL